MVTANIKDFYLYPLLFSSEEETLYDVLNETYVQIPTQAREMILQDADFQALLHELRALKQ
ncbi:hypothetical protein [Bacillus sp. CECT 9360]|uniref:hypothetical protein n=1 Tax=Bacillus sp. CECT 9360 TaxID=2845821 RepID=UPI001E2A4879|nr:hypothetical protein [Bacillus sp. CECT 9360]